MTIGIKNLAYGVTRKLLTLVAFACCSAAYGQSLGTTFSDLLFACVGGGKKPTA